MEAGVVSRLNYEFGFYVFMLAAFLGFELFEKFSVTAHASDVADERDCVDLGGRGDSDLRRKRRVHAFASFGICGGGLRDDQPGQRILITDRMLKMFKKREPAQEMNRLLPGSLHYRRGCFILALKWMSAPAMSRRGVIIGRTRHAAGGGRRR